MSEQKNTTKSEKTGCGKTFLIIFIILCVIAGIGSCFNNDSIEIESSRCAVCGKSYTNSDDVRSIALRNMCEKCYKNFEYNQNLKKAIEEYME